MSQFRLSSACVVQFFYPDELIGTINELDGHLVKFGDPYKILIKPTTWSRTGILPFLIIRRVLLSRSKCSNERATRCAFHSKTFDYKWKHIYFGELLLQHAKLPFLPYV